jgi:hypothetical protein
MILERLLPANIDFFRTPIPKPPTKRVSISVPATSAVFAAAGTAEDGLLETHEAVSTSDIAKNLTAILASHTEGSHVALTQDDISFIEEGERTDHVNHLGHFVIEIQIDGGAAVRRNVRVKAQG